MKKWKEKRTMCPKNITWCKCKDGIIVKYMERVRRTYEELDGEKGTVGVNGVSTRMHSLGVAEELCGRTSGEVYRETETKYGGRKRW